MSAVASNGLRAEPLDLPALLKECGLAALVVFALAAGLVGFRTVDVSGGLDIEYRFDDVAVAVCYTFLGRMALVLLRWRRPVPVALLATGFSVLSLLLLLSHGIFDLLGAEATAETLKRFLPFDSPVVSWVVLAVAVVFAVRGWRMWLGGVEAAAEREARLERIGAQVQRATRYLAPVLLLLAIALPFLPFTDRRVLDIGVLVMTYVMLGWGLNIVVGLAGLLDLGYVAFYAVGAYSYALLAQHLGMGFWVCLPFAGAMAATAGLLLGFPVLRLRGDYLAIVTLGFGEIIRIILLNWYKVTKGPDGISGIPRPTLFGLEFRAGDEGTFAAFFGLDYASIQRVAFLYYLILAMALVTNLFTLRIRKLPIGRAWEALREDEIACRALGINPTNTKLTAFAIGAMFAGFAGSFFATRQGFISPESFTFIESAVILAIVVLGGMGSQIGVVFAAVVLIALPEFFRDLQQFRMLAFGAAMVLIMLWRPSGLLSHREPTIRMPPKGAGGGR